MQSYLVFMLLMIALGVSIPIIFLIWLHRRDMSKGPPPPPPPRRQPEKEEGPD